MERMDGLAKDWSVYPLYQYKLGEQQKLVQVREFLKR